MIEQFPVEGGAYIVNTPTLTSQTELVQVFVNARGRLLLTMAAPMKRFLDATGGVWMTGALVGKVGSGRGTRNGTFSGNPIWSSEPWDEGWFRVSPFFHKSCVFCLFLMVSWFASSHIPNGV